jgi:hypothetical protein
LKEPQQLPKRFSKHIKNNWVYLVIAFLL